jgi:hypothetical protein
MLYVSSHESHHLASEALRINAIDSIRRFSNHNARREQRRGGDALRVHARCHTHTLA